MEWNLSKHKSYSTVAIVGSAGRGDDGNKLTKDLFDKMSATAEEIIVSAFWLNPADVVLVSGGAAFADHVAVRLFLDGEQYQDRDKEEEKKMEPTAVSDVSVVTAVDNTKTVLQSPENIRQKTSHSRWKGLHLHMPCKLQTFQPTASTKKKTNAIKNPDIDTMEDTKQQQQIQFVDSGIYNWKSNPGFIANLLHKNFIKKTGIKSFNELYDVSIIPNCNIETEHRGFHGRNSEIAKSDYIIAFTWGESTAVPKDGGTCDTWRKSHAHSTKKVHVPLSRLEAGTYTVAEKSKSASSASTSSLSSISTDTSTVTLPLLSQTVITRKRSRDKKEDIGESTKVSESQSTE